MFVMEGEAPLTQDLLIKNSDDAVPSSSSTGILTQKPGKRPTRQWAAWTRQEEENFFSALRQVGKNFEKITCRVQSKNKDQVRHYYYRLLRRMNKLLSPGVYLDAKNAKDTIAAMLRWWSLLEKFSCTASKLHLKPRRFKVFVEALESQLLKDRNKTRRKRYSGDICLPTQSHVLDKGTGDTRSVKLVAADAPNTNKIVNTKGDSYKHEMISNIINRKDSSSTKARRQKERTVLLASAAYKRWEKAAIAGVSLVADAAEQLEQSKNGGNYLLSHDAHGKGICSNEMDEPTIEPAGKLKLQLFPLNESTRRALEEKSHNPYLELTLSARKKISSVLEHLNHKWGNSCISSAELMLLPYNIQHDLASCQRWSSADTLLSTADVHAIVGSPCLFRLRYGWFTSAKQGSESPQDAPRALYLNRTIMPSDESPKDYIVINSPDTDNICIGDPPITCISKQPLESPHGEPASAMSPTIIDSPESKMEEGFLVYDDEFREYLRDGPSWIDKKSTDENTRKEEADATTKCGALSLGEWADSLTNISIGDLFSEASKAAKACCTNCPIGRSDPLLQQNPFSCDSFDAAVAADVSGQQLTALSTHASIFTAEETCDEFSFRMTPAWKQEGMKTSATASIASSKQPSCAALEGPNNSLEDYSHQGPMDDPQCDLRADVESGIDGYHLEEDICLTDVYWPDSLGPLDLDIPSTSKFGGEDLIIGESLSLSGFSRMISNSLVASHGCSLFGIHGKDSGASSEAC